MQLVIAEKPSVARDIARVLDVRPQGQTAFVGKECVITWCVGHLVELDEPAAYDARWKAWRLDTLPMLPATFKLRAAQGTASQYKAVAQLLTDKRFTHVVNACDAGREGELIFRYVYDLAGSRLPIKRLWISSMTDEAIRTGFARLRAGVEYDALGAAARCRSEADWLVGLNATRAVTVRYRSAGGQNLYSIGRVQTPTLAILVERERAVRSFVPKDYFEVRGTFTTKEGGTFRALWTRLTPPLPKATRLAKLVAANTIVDRCQSHATSADVAGPVVETLEQKKTSEPPPLLFDLTSLQRTANRRFGLSATRTLEVAQALYERHKVLTYPRTDARHLSSDMVAELPKLFGGVAQIPQYTPFARPLVQVPPVPPRRVFDDKKVHDHHAIVPTGKVVDISRLDRDEQRVFDLVVRRFLGAFYPDAEFANTEAVIRVGPGAVTTVAASASKRLSNNKRASVEGDIEEDEEMLDEAPPAPDRFVARGRIRLVPGWHVVAGFGDKPGEGEADAQEPTLPALAKDARLDGTFESITKQTKPPPRHTEGTLLAAMETAGRHIEDEELRAAMKEAGLGTPATRASIIETLVKRTFVQRQAKQIVPTETGMALIASLPVPTLASPELTGSWEARLSRIARGQDTRDAFMRDIAIYVTDVVEAVRKAPLDRAMSAVAQVAPASPAPKPARAAERSANATAGSPAPRAKRPVDKPAKPKAPSPKASAAKAPVAATIDTLTCPRCKQGTLVRGNRGWGCSRWKAGCAFVVWFELEGKALSDTQLRELVAKGKTRKTSWPTAPGAPAKPGRLVLDLGATRERGAARFAPEPS